MTIKEKLTRRNAVKLGLLSATVSVLAKTLSVPASAQDLGPGNRYVGEIGGRNHDELFTGEPVVGGGQMEIRLNQSIYKAHCEPNTVIMHPLPRDSRAEANELDNDLNQHPSLAIFRQADNGVLIRMALFVLTLGVDKDIHLTSSKVNWGTDRKF